MTTPWSLSKILTWGTVAASVLVLASCTAGSEGIFASIEREQKVVSLGGLSTTATVTSMAELGGQYFASGGKALFARSTVSGTTKWDNATVGGHTEVVAVGTAGGKLFAVAAGTLYQAADPTRALSEMIWSAVALAAGDSAENLVPVRLGDGFSSTELIVVSNASGVRNHVYRLDATSGALSAPITLPVVAQFGVQAAIFDGTDYYLLSETSITKVNSSLVATEALKTSGFGHDFASLIYLNGTSAVGGHVGYYLTTMSNANVGGGLYKAATIAGLGSGALSTNVQMSSYPTSLAGLLYNKENDSLWIGTVAASSQVAGRGYIELSLGSNALNTTPLTGTNNYSSTVLPTSAIGVFFRSSSDLCFLGTLSNGLWTWTHTGASSSATWNQQ